MAVTLVRIVVGVSALVLVYALLRARRGGAGAPWALPAGLGPFFGAAAAGLVIGALLTLPTRTPWSPGQTLAPGLLLGGFGVLLAGGWLRPGRFDPDSTEGGFL